MELLTGTVSVNKLLLAGTVPINKFLLDGTPKKIKFPTKNVHPFKLPLSAAPKVLTRSKISNVGNAYSNYIAHVWHCTIKYN